MGNVDYSGPEIDIDDFVQHVEYQGVIHEITQ
jgi:hypothetical protein